MAEGGMAESGDEPSNRKARRRVHLSLMAGGFVTIAGGLFLGMFGVAVMGAYVHDPKDILIPLGATAFATSAMSFFGAFAIFDHDNYALAIIGSATPASFFLGGCVIAMIAESGIWTVFLPLGLLGASGILLVATSREAFAVD